MEKKRNMGDTMARKEKRKTGDYGRGRGAKKIRGIVWGKRRRKKRNTGDKINTLFEVESLGYRNHTNQGRDIADHPQVTATMPLDFDLAQH
jgi:hypothetical protein